MKMNYTFLIFIGIFLTLYGLLHFYFYRKVIGAFHPALPYHILIILILLFLMMSPIIMRVIDGKVPDIISNIITYTGYIWMGIIFLLFSFNLVVDLYQFIVYILSRVFDTSLLKLLPDKKVTLLIIVSLITLINIYGFFEAGHIKTERITLPTHKLPPGVETLRIVQITDTHFSRINGFNLANKIAGIVAGLEPDVLVSTGDFLDDGLKEVEKVQSLFRSLNVKYGKYAATGNHFFITGILNAEKFTKNCGFKLLRNESINVTDFLTIAAIDDPAADRDGSSPLPDEAIILDKLSSDHINLYLKHQPLVKKENIGKFDLQLSGHTHNGQIFPFRYLVSLFYKYMTGLYDLGNNSLLYVSRGTGTWGPPIRFLSPPEITVIDFVKKTSIIHSER
ncbi:metallophosphoesterase [Thermodesulfobacteriota bacterium]